MKKTEKVKFLINTLEDLYPKVEVPLNHKDPYTLLIAVLLSAQSTDAGVNKITPKLFAKADNPYDMIKMSIVFKFVFKICSRLSDCTIKELLTKNILNKLNKYGELKSISF